MRIVVLLFAVLVIACGHRPSNPTPISQPGDNQLSCTELAQQMADNHQKALILAGKDEDLESQNVAAFLLFTPAIDLSNTEQIEYRALEDRNKNLARLREQKGCPETSTAPK